MTELGVRRILFRELLEGDYRKLRAESNDDPGAGGGARDLRFPFAEFDDIMSRFLPLTRTETRQRNGVPTDVSIRYGPVRLEEVDEAGNVLNSTTNEFVWEPPTTARHTEGRIARIHSSNATRRFLDLQNDAMGKLFLLLVQDELGEVRVHFAYEQDLRDGKWDSTVSRPILDCMDDLDRSRKTVQGYIDLLNDFKHCHGAR